jgi:eukaryotic-like serine/threonine-protein kinase
LPTPFGKYQLQRKLAEGGMAEVFLAKQAGVEGFEKLVVIKRILPSLLAEQEFVRMFINEARLAARLNHPNIVQIFDLGKIDDLYFIAMEYVHGEDIRSLVVESNTATSRPPAGIICRILTDTLAGLHYAHTRVGTDGKPLGLVHRDVSPQNVLVTYEGSVKLVDFGIAKATRATSEQTQAGLFKGKFSYMAPEQTRGQPIDARADVFAVGILLWELLTWRRLFKKNTEMATLIAVSEEPIAPPKQIRPDLPDELNRIVMRALARPLSERYGSAQEMRADLEALIRAQGWEADALSVSSFMRETFAAKLKAQEADVRAAGLASLDDFLLTVDEGTRVTWMQAAHVQHTPSAGLPTAPSDAPSETVETELYDAPATKANDLPPSAGAMSGATTMPRPLPNDRPLPGMKPIGGAPGGANRPIVGGGLASASGVTTVDEVSASMREAPRSPRVTAPLPPAPPPPPARRGSVPPGTPAPPAQKNGPGASAYPQTASALPPPAAPPAPGASMHHPPGASMHHPPGASMSQPPGASGLTPPPAAPMPSGYAQRSPPSGTAAVPGSGAYLSAPSAPEVAQPTVIAPMPSGPYAAVPQGQQPGAGQWADDAQPATVMSPPRADDPGSTAKQQAYNPPSRGRRIVVIVVAAMIVTAVTLAVLLWPSSSTPQPTPVTLPTAPDTTPSSGGGAREPSGASTLATLDITLDKDAIISVDGNSEPLGRHAVVQVQPGVVHTVSVQRAGHAAHKFHIAAPAANERMPVSLKVP